jgi:hypothetical protein
VTIRLLVTARDAAAALHLIEIVRAASEMPDFDLCIVTQSPATRYFEQANLSTRHVNVGPVRSKDGPEAAGLLRIAKEIIDELQPNAVLCGLSTPFDGGIDEAVLASYTGPSFVMQDFWGEANGFFGKRADLYFALDNEAVRLSRLQHQVEAVVVGSPRHSAYARLDVSGARIDIRRRLSLQSNASVCSFFGQALHSLEGYRRMLRAWAVAVLHQPYTTIAAYRPHPRESESDAAWTMNLFREIGLELVLLNNMDVESALLASDVVCSAFSNCTYDAAYLNYFSDVPLNTPMSLFFEKDVIDYFRRMVRLDEFPYLKDGLVMTVRNGDELSHQMALAASPAEKHRYWEASKKLAAPTEAPARVLDAIRNRCGIKS